VITLLVSPEDAARLAMASTQGKIQLALRNTIDSKRVEPASVLEANLFSGASAQAAPAPKRTVKTAPPPAPSPYTIEVITGSKRENKSFPNQ
jgi:Flp pilus assembly protein CpaB